MPSLIRSTILLFTLSLTPVCGQAAWQRHTIDNTSQGADGVRLADLNHDGRPDIATGWEEGGVVRVYLQPQPQHIRQPWPVIEAGKVDSPEDAVITDVDGDGHPDVVSCCEGQTRTVFVHWNPGPMPSDTLWKTTAFPQHQHKYPWMFCLPREDRQQQATELILGSKGGQGVIGRLIPPETGSRRQLQHWSWQRLSPAGWIMSLQHHDLDGNGQPDLLVSDRRGPRRGVFALLRPATPAAAWQRLWLGARDREVMFLASGDVNGDQQTDVVVTARNSSPVLLTAPVAAGTDWTPVPLPWPAAAGTGKGVAIGDLDRNGTADLVFSCEHAEGKVGVFQLTQDATQAPTGWNFEDISGTAGIKFDRIELLDLDGDGDLDVLTCEERDQLGVIWYENPHLPSP